MAIEVEMSEADVRGVLRKMGYHNNYTDALIIDARELDFTDTPKMVLLHDKESKLFVLMTR
jgi:hypothetical protein